MKGIPEFSHDFLDFQDTIFPFGFFFPILFQLFKINNLVFCFGDRKWRLVSNAKWRRRKMKTVSRVRILCTFFSIFDLP